MIITSRNQAFQNMANKNIYSKKLLRTRACRNVTPRYPGAPWGVCNRRECTFAHTLEEYQDPPCSFDTGCRLVDHPTKTCMFRHSWESRPEYIKRTGKSPKLPPGVNKKTPPSNTPRPKTPPSILSSIKSSIKSSITTFAQTIGETKSPKSPKLPKLPPVEIKETVISVPEDKLKLALMSALESGALNIRVVTFKE